MTALSFFVNRYVDDVHAAEDIAIDAFTELVVHRGRFDFRVSLKTYLYMIGRSRALNYIKRRNRIRMESLSEAEQLLDQLTLEEKVLADQRKRLVHQGLSQLPEDMRLAVHLVYLEGLSYEETARILKKTRKQVDNLLYRGKKALRAILGEEGANL